MTENESSPLEIVQSYLGILGRRKWWVLVTFPCVALAVLLIIAKVPKVYTSYATLVVDQQKVLEQYVVSGDTTSAADAIQKMKRAVLSHTRLLGIVDELGLYAEDRDRERPETLTTIMRDDIGIEPLDEIGKAGGRAGDFAAFEISFNAATPELAQAAVGKITELFIDEDRRVRGDQTAHTVDFVKSGLEAAAKKVADQERRLDAARAADARRDRQRVNSATEASELRAQLQSVQNTLNLLQQRRYMLESNGTVDLAKLRDERDALLAKYTSRHADVIRKEGQIARLQALLDQLRTGSGSVPASGQDDPATAQMRAQVNSLMAENASATQEERRLRGELAGAQMAGTSGGGDQSTTELLRDYEIYKKEYMDLVASEQRAQRMVTLSDRQEEAQFRMIDPPTLPITPSSPKVLLLNLGGAAAGLILGLVLAILADVKDGGVHSERDLSEIASVPLILSIPVIRTQAETKALATNRIFTWAVACLIVVGVAAIEYYAYAKG